jgi:hypothetical protein
MVMVDADLFLYFNRLAYMDVHEKMGIYWKKISYALICPRYKKLLDKGCYNIILTITYNIGNVNIKN